MNFVKYLTPINQTLFFMSGFIILTIFLFILMYRIKSVKAFGVEANLNGAKSSTSDIIYILNECEQSLARTYELRREANELMESYVVMKLSEKQTEYEARFSEDMLSKGAYDDSKMLFNKLALESLTTMTLNYFKRCIYDNHFTQKNEHEFLTYKESKTSTILSIITDRLNRFFCNDEDLRDNFALEVPALREIFRGCFNEFLTISKNRDLMISENKSTFASLVNDFCKVR